MESTGLQLTRPWAVKKCSSCPKFWTRLNPRWTLRLLALSSKCFKFHLVYQFPRTPFCQFAFCLCPSFPFLSLLVSPSLILLKPAVFPKRNVHKILHLSPEIWWKLLSLPVAKVCKKSASWRLQSKDIKSKRSKDLTNPPNPYFPICFSDFPK